MHGTCIKVYIIVYDFRIIGPKMVLLGQSMLPEYGICIVYAICVWLMNSFVIAINKKDNRHRILKG